MESSLGSLRLGDLARDKKEDRHDENAMTEEIADSDQLPPGADRRRNHPNSQLA